jgi:carbon monoxide dehydrogenase subunit G
VKVQGERKFAAPRLTVWRVLQDPAQMAELMPGVESFDVEDDRHWKANVKIPLGLGSLKMSINFEKLEEREPEFSQLRAKGTGVGALMNLVTQFNLSEQDGGTAMAWEADVRIAGPVGSMGQRVLQPIVNQQVQQVLTALDAQVAKAEGGEKPETDPETKDAGPPAETTPEADPAKEAGSSGAEEGISPLEEESYSEER